MLKKMGELNPIIFAKDRGEVVEVEDLNMPESMDCLLELIKEVLRNGYIEDLLCTGPKHPLINEKNVEKSQINYFQIMQVVENK